MKKEIQILHNDEINRQDWTDLLLNCAQASFFQSPKGFELLNQFNDWNVGVIGCKVDGALDAVLVYVIQKESGLKAFLSKRCIVFSGPLFKSSFGLMEVLKELNAQSEGSIYLEIRNGHSSKLYENVYQDLGWKYVPWLNFIVDTSDHALMHKRMSESRRRQLKKAEKNGVTFCTPKSNDEIVEFYAILQDLYQKRIKKPLPGYALFEHFYKADARNFVLVYLDKKVIGGILCPFLENVATYEFYIAGLDHQYRDCYPSAMATFGAMKQSLEMGIPVFDFMGGGSPEEDYGVREFKSRFGGEQVEWGRWLKIKKAGIYQLGKMYIKWRSK